MGLQAFDDILSDHLTRPAAAFIRLLRQRAADLDDLLERPVGLEQYPGRQAPKAFTRLFQVGLTTPRRYDNGANNGFEKLAPVVTPGTFLAPRNGSIKVGRNGAFVLSEVSLNTYLNWTYSANPHIGGFSAKTFTTQGDLFDPAIDNNGGALVMNNNRLVDIQVSANGGDPTENQPTPNVSFEIGFYDKTRGRYLHDGDRLPSQLFSGQHLDNRRTPALGRFDVGSEIEPRLFVNEVRMRTLLDTDTAYNAAQVKVFVLLTLKGKMLQVLGGGR